MEGTEIDECPVSFISPATLSLMGTLDVAELARPSGAALYGPDLSKWPARMVDALVTIEIERTKADNARQEAAD